MTRAPINTAPTAMDRIANTIKAARDAAGNSFAHAKLEYGDIVAAYDEFEEMKRLRDHWHKVAMDNIKYADGWREKMEKFKTALIEAGQLIQDHSCYIGESTKPLENVISLALAEQVENE